jgi:flagellin
MAIIVNTNIASLIAQRNLGLSSEGLSKSMERLASGLRINRAADDAAGMGLSLRMTGQIRSLGQASRNTMDGISLIQVAEGAYNEIGNILVRLRELAIQAANGTLSTADRQTLQVAADRLIQEVSGIANSTQFNGVVLLAGTSTGGLSNTVVFQVGIGTVGYTVSATDQIAVTLYSLKASAFTSSGSDISTLAITSASNALVALNTLDTVITNLTSSRASLGAAQNGLESRSRNLTISIENLSAARSRILDVDVAQETSEMVRNQILVQAGTSVLAQANQLPSLALTLLGG